MNTPARTVSPLRQRMLEDMRMRKFAPRTQTAYIRAVRRFAAYLGRPPDAATIEDLRNFQLYLVDQGTSPTTLNATISGLKFFCEITLDRAELTAKMQPVHVPRTLPVVLSREEVARLIAATGNLKHQTALSLAYGTGLRASEVVSLKVSDIDSTRMLSRLFRRRFLEELAIAHGAGKLRFYSEHTDLADPKAFAQWLAPLRRCEWVVYAKKPFAGPQAVLAYLSRYTHRVAISNSRLVAHDERGVTFRWKDYRDKGQTRHKVMTLKPEEFMRRFLLHVLPSGFHRIRHYGLLANNHRRECIAQARQLLVPDLPGEQVEKTRHAGAEPDRPTFVCVHCGAMMLIVETFARGQSIRTPHQRGPP